MRNEVCKIDNRYPSNVKTKSRYVLYTLFPEKKNTYNQHYNYYAIMTQTDSDEQRNIRRL